MQEKTKLTRSKKESTWLTVAILLIIPIGILLYFARDYIEEPIIAQEFHQDVKQFPNIHINRFMLWESDSLVDITIRNKGEVSFWYGIDRIPRIEHIGKYSTTYQCFYRDTAGKKSEEAFTTDLELDTDTYAKWFPFKVRSLKDLITHYDEIVSIVKTFPKAPHFSEYSDELAFEKTMIFQNKQAVCDLLR